MEHIIQNSIGGILKRPLLCKCCNDSFGNGVDAALAKALNPFANLLNIKRDRGTPQPIEGRLETGERILLFPDGNAKIRDVESNIVIGDDGQPKLHVKGPDINSIRQRLIGLKRKQYPKLDIEKALEGFNIDSRPPEEYFTSTLDFGDPLTFTAVSKCAINFYMSCGGSREQIKHLLPDIENASPSKDVEFFYPDAPLVEELPRDLFHHLVLIGSPIEKILYCYVSFFGTLSYVVC